MADGIAATAFRPHRWKAKRMKIAPIPIASGKPLRVGKLIRAKGSDDMVAMLASGIRAVSTEISPETRAGGFILPNDGVDVIASRRDGAAERPTGIESMVAEMLPSDGVTTTTIPK
jgi:pilus assembly protein CpaB